MRAHIIENGKIINTIEVESLDVIPNLIEATEGSIGWDYIDGQLIDNTNTENITPEESIKNEIFTLEISITPRRTREAILGTDNGWLADIESQIETLRSQL